MTTLDYKRAARELRCMRIGFREFRIEKGVADVEDHREAFIERFQLEMQRLWWRASYTGRPLEKLRMNGLYSQMNGPEA